MNIEQAETMEMLLEWAIAKCWRASDVERGTAARVNALADAMAQIRAAEVLIRQAEVDLVNLEGRGL